QSLRKGEIASPSLYRHLRFCGDYFANNPTLKAHRILLGQEVSCHLNPGRGGLTLSMSWLDTEAPLPSLSFSTMVGVRHMAWMQVAQALCGAHSLLYCSECSAWYARKGRRPQEGRQNFCSE